MNYTYIFTTFGHLSQLECLLVSKAGKLAFSVANVIKNVS